MYSLWRVSLYSISNFRRVWQESYIWGKIPLSVASWIFRVKLGNIVKCYKIIRFNRMKNKHSLVVHIIILFFVKMDYVIHLFKNKCKILIFFNDYSNKIGVGCRPIVLFFVPQASTLERFLRTVQIKLPSFIWWTFLQYSFRIFCSTFTQVQHHFI